MNSAQTYDGISIFDGSRERRQGICSINVFCQVVSQCICHNKNQQNVTSNTSSIWHQDTTNTHTKQKSNSKQGKLHNIKEGQNEQKTKARDRQRQNLNENYDKQEEQMLRQLTFKCKIAKIVLVISLKYTPVTKSILCLIFLMCGG